MTVAERLASAPVSFGVWERTVGRDDLVPRDELLEAVASLGYRALELGPPGYLGADAEAVGEALAPFELELAGGFAPLHLADEERFRADLAELERTLEVLAAWPQAPALLADAGAPERSRAAGRPAELRRTALSGPSLERAVARLTRAAEACAARGVRAALHPETGSYAESPWDVEALLERVDEELLGLCFDTGHVLVGGGSPVSLARDWGERIVHVHLKDVSGAVLARLRGGRVDVETAWAEGLFCPLGEGEVDLAGVLAAPAVREARWLVLEQDRVAVTRAELDAVRDAEARSRELVLELAGSV